MVAAASADWTRQVSDSAGCLAAYRAKMCPKKCPGSEQVDRRISYT